MEEASFESLLSKVLEKYRVESSRRQNQLEDSLKTHHEEIEVYKKRERQYIATIGKLKNKLLLKSEETKQLRDLLTLHNIDIPPLNELINIHSTKSHNDSSSTAADTSVLPEATPTATPTNNITLQSLNQTTGSSPTEVTPTSQDPPSSSTPPVAVSPSSGSTSNTLSSSQGKRSLRLSRLKKRSIYHETNTSDGVRTGEKSSREQENEIKNSSENKTKPTERIDRPDEVIVIDDMTPVGVASSKEGVVTNIEADSQSVSSDDTVLCESKRFKETNETIPLFNTRCYDDDDDEELTCYHDDGEESVWLLNERKGEELNKSMSPSVLSQAFLSEEYPLPHQTYSTSHDFSDKSHDLNKESESLEGAVLSAAASRKRKRRRKRRRKGVAMRLSSLQTTLTQHIPTDETEGKSPHVIPPTPFIKASPLQSSSRSGWKTDLISNEASPPLKRTDDNNNNNEKALAARAGLPTYKCVVNLRKKSDREKLRAKSCPECERWYKNNNGLYDNSSDQLRKTCRHRHLYLPPESDPTIWNIEFPDTAKATESVPKDDDTEWNDDST